MTPLTKLFYWEVALATASGLLSAVTLVWRDWLELAFHVDPDHGDGSLEWLVVGVAAALALTLCVLARKEWRRVREA